MTMGHVHLCLYPIIFSSELQYPRARSRDIRWSKPLNFMIPEAFSHDCAAGK